MADVNRGNRPLSPHLQVYRLPMPAITSILTRITGHALSAGILLLVWWLVAAVASPGAFATMFKRSLGVVPSSYQAATGAVGADHL